jgi:hypothetical protein
MAFVKIFENVFQVEAEVSNKRFISVGLEVYKTGK